MFGRGRAIWFVLKHAFVPFSVGAFVQALVTPNEQWTAAFWVPFVLALIAWNAFLYFAFALPTARRRSSAMVSEALHARQGKPQPK